MKPNVQMPFHQAAWNKGKLVGQKIPLKLKEIWAIRIRLQLTEKVRDLALFNLAIDSKLRGCDLLSLKVSDIAHERSNIPELDVPDRERFERNAAAWAYFQAAPPGHRKTILNWITSAKRQETRRKRLEQLMQECAAGKRLT